MPTVALLIPISVFTPLLVLLSYYCYLLLDMCGSCWASREGIAQVEAESERMWIGKARRGERGEKVCLDEEEGGDVERRMWEQVEGEKQDLLVTREGAPKEVEGMRYEIVDGRGYATLAL